MSIVCNCYAWEGSELHVTIQLGKLKVRNHVGTDWGVQLI